MNNRQKFAALLITTTMASGAMASNVEMDAHGQKSVTIEYADLNIANEAGAKTLYKRIEKAALKVCSVTTGVAPIGVLRAQESCVNATVAAAVKKVDSDSVERLHQS